MDIPNLNTLQVTDFDFNALREKFSTARSSAKELKKMSQARSCSKEQKNIENADDDERGKKGSSL